MQTHPDCGGLEIPADRIWAPPLAAAPTHKPYGATGAPKTTAEVLQACLPAYVLDGRPSLRLAAEITGIGVRNLQRCLRNEGTSYSRILDRASFEVARRQIADTDLPLTEIAFKLGYSEQSAFSRAFREWAGIAPSAFRKQLGSGAGTGNAPVERSTH